MAVIKALSSGAGIEQAINYITQNDKTEGKLVTGINCQAGTAKEEMQATKELWGKTGGRTYKHFVQSYHKSEQITPEQAHKNALELAKNTKAWKGFEVLVATHVDKEHIHSHFIINSVNYTNGYKLRWSKKDLVDLKNRCNEQSIQQGLHVPEKGKTFFGQEREETVAWSKDTYKLLKKAENGEVKSYVQDIALAVMDCKEQATSRENFINLMKKQGYRVDWQDNHKYITFTDLTRQEQGERQCKIRNNKLEKYYAIDFGKESLENGFKVNAGQQAERERARQQLNSPTDPKNGRIGETSPESVQKNSGDESENIKALISELKFIERVAEEKQNNSATERERRNIQQERLNTSRERQIKKTNTKGNGRGYER